MNPITKLRLRLWWHFFWPPWEKPRWKVVLRFQTSKVWSGYWAFVNHIETGEKRIIGPVAQYSMQEAIEAARKQAHEVLYPESFTTTCANCAACPPISPAFPHGTVVECRHCGRTVLLPANSRANDAHRWKQPADPHAAQVRMLANDEARLECACGWSVQTAVSSLDAAQKDHAAHKQQEQLSA